MKFNQVIWKFIRDEHGNEALEFGMTALLISAGSVKGMNEVKMLTHDKHDELLEQFATLD